MTDQQEQPSQATSQPAPSEAPAFSIPETYKDRGWVEKIKSPDDLFKAYDNAQSLLGKRPAGIPANDAPQEEWDKFYQAARPEAPEKYTLSDIDGLPEGTDLTPYKAQAQKLMFEAGLTQRQADAMWKQYVEIEVGAVKQSQEELDKRYDETVTKVFGDKKEQSEKLAQDLINQYVPEELKANVKALVNTPEAMVGVIALANEMQAKHEAELEAIRKEYGAEGKLPDGGTKAAAEDISETVAKLSKLRLSPEAQDFTKAGHAKVMNEIAELQAVVARHYNK